MSELCVAGQSDPQYYEVDEEDAVGQPAEDVEAAPLQAVTYHRPTPGEAAQHEDAEERGDQGPVDGRIQS